MSCMTRRSIRGGRSERPRQSKHLCVCVHSCVTGRVGIATFHQGTRFFVLVVFLTYAQGDHQLRQKGGEVFSLGHTGEDIYFFFSFPCISSTLSSVQET